MSKIKQVWQSADGTTFPNKKLAEIYQKKHEAIQGLVELINKEFSNQNDQRDVRDFIVTNKIYLTNIFKELE